MEKHAFQDLYPEELAICYGCGRLNQHGHQIKSYWDGDAATCEFMPKPEHTAFPGYVYGGLIASVIDCHSTGTAAAAALRAAEGDDIGTPRFVTGSLHVDYLKPTPIDVPFTVRATIEEVKGRKVVITTSLMSGDVETARGRVVAIQIPEHLVPGNK